MENNYYSPVQILENNIKAGINKANMGLLKMILLGMFAGMFIAIGAEGSNLAAHNLTGVGVARTLTGVIFPIGLMMLVVTGGELFTGNCMLTMALADHKIKALQMIKNWVVVYFSNMLGTILTAACVYASGQYDYSDGALGAFTIKVAMGKADIDISKAIFSGILCNILVCIAVLMSSAAKDLIGKLFGAFFPILIFVISGFEHCVANMYYIPAGIIASGNSKYLDKACELYGYTSAQISDTLTVGGFVHNLLPVTLGNIIGGGIVVSLGLYAAHLVLDKKEK